MGVLTISLEDKTERDLRRIAKERYGDTKGAISKVITEAVKKNKHDAEQEKVKKRALEILDKGFHMGKLHYKNRAELYARNWQVKK